MVEECQCPTQFPMIRVSEGKYRIGETRVLIFVRVSENFKTKQDLVLKMLLIQSRFNLKISFSHCFGRSKVPTT